MVEATLPALPLSEQSRVEVSELARPADLLLGSFGPAPLALDFSVVHPLHFNASLAEVTAGCAAERRAKEKEVESRELCRAVGRDFSPVVLETTGAWSSSTSSFVRKWAKQVGLATGAPVAETLPVVSRLLSHFLARAVAQHLLRGFASSQPRLPSL